MAKVTPEISAQILALSATHSNRQIEAILSEQGIKLSNVSIGKIVNEYRKDRAGQTKEVVNEHIKKTVITDLDILENLRDEIYSMFGDRNLRASERLMCSDRLVKVIDTRLKYSGAGDESPGSIAEELKAARERLNRANHAD
ncbi:MAG TPA: hypothetical protein VGC12_00270 [Methyloradius sp.]